VSAYDVAFALAEEWSSLGVSALLDMNLGWTFHWEQVDALRQRHRLAKIVPIVLRCSRQTCLERIELRALPSRPYSTRPRGS
jgi:hypothetical protein